MEFQLPIKTNMLKNKDFLLSDSKRFVFILLINVKFSRIFGGLTHTDDTQVVMKFLEVR